MTRGRWFEPRQLQFFFAPILSRKLIYLITVPAIIIIIIYEQMLLE